jgi:hypothetical protein
MANRRMVEMMATKLLELRSCRYADIARMLQLIVVAVFTPTGQDIACKEMFGALAVARQVAKYEQTYETRGEGGLRGLWNRFWGKLPEPVSFSK